jgi:hypothetical protein
MTVSVMGERDTLRKTFLLTRGQYDQPAEEVRASGLPAVLKFDTTKLSRNRLGLAAWTFSKTNPLTARVFVNRMWQEIFGRGIVKTSGDFGMQGELPTHPELLDWIAADFVEHGWNIKRLIKQMVMSAAYRQSAKIPVEKLKKDPENILLSRGPRNRLQAEFARDMVMASSGLLDKTIGGPSVKPYQPKGLWEAATSGRGVLATYVMDSGQNLYRRGMYTFIKLTVPPPSMILFDASNRDQCEVKRGKTNTPLQALLMMNDPTILEASRVLAQNMMLKKQSDDETIKEIFRRIICRNPSDKEIQVLKQYLTEQKMAFRNAKLDAKTTLAHGASPLNTSLNKDDLAAWMKMVNLVYNMEEAIMK